MVPLGHRYQPSTLRGQGHLAQAQLRTWDEPSYHSRTTIYALAQDDSEHGRSSAPNPDVLSAIPWISDDEIQSWPRHRSLARSYAVAEDDSDDSLSAAPIPRHARLHYCSVSNYALSRAARTAAPATIFATHRSWTEITLSLWTTRTTDGALYPTPTRSAALQLGS